MIYKRIVGTSVQNREIIALSNVNLSEPVSNGLTLIIGGTHGDERATVPILEHFISDKLTAENITAPICVVPLLNPDGYHLNTRANANNVDINRNLPYNWREDSEELSGTEPLTEPESRAIFQFIQTQKPVIVASLHWALAEIDPDGAQSIELAQYMWDALAERDKKRFRLKLENNAGSECPGSLGQWCGYGLIYPDNTRPVMITLELPYTHDAEKDLFPLPPDNFSQVVSIWEKDEELYLGQIEPSVHDMLKVACKYKIV